MVYLYLASTYLSGWPNGAAPRGVIRPGSEAPEAPEVSGGPGQFHEEGLRVAARCVAAALGLARGDRLPCGAPKIANLVQITTISL